MLSSQSRRCASVGAEKASLFKSGSHLVKCLPGTSLSMVPTLTQHVPSRPDDRQARASHRDKTHCQEAALPFLHYGDPSFLVP